MMKSKVKSFKQFVKEKDAKAIRAKTVEGSAAAPSTADDDVGSQIAQTIGATAGGIAAYPLGPYGSALGGLAGSKIGDAAYKAAKPYVEPYVKPAVDAVSNAASSAVKSASSAASSAANSVSNAASTVMKKVGIK